MIVRSLLALSASCSLAAAFVQSGHATAEWWTASLRFKPGQPVETGIRLMVEEGWHTYWSNPGEGGMKLSVELKLPEGWKATEPAHPVPKRFKTGGLAGFGYEGEVIFPVTVTPPEDAKEAVELVAKISWLTCDDSACVPGEAELQLPLAPGKVDETANSRLLYVARQRVPQPLEGAELAVAEEGKTLTLSLKLPPGAKIDPAKAEVFPETLQAVDPAAEITFGKSGDGWTATVPKNEYASGPLKELSLVIAPEEDGERPVQVVWRAE